MNKRGISVIISSILLILIVISLFSVVAYFLRRSPENIMEKGTETFEKMINCDNIDLQIENVCYDNAFEYTNENGEKEQGTLISVEIKNNNNFKLENFRIKLSSGETDIKAPNQISIEGYNVATVNFAFPGLTNKIEWAKIYPIINGETCDSKEYKININERTKKC